MPRKRHRGEPFAHNVTLPVFCDFSCPHASFAPKDAVGACRRELAVYCTLLKRYNNKNGRCIARK